MDTRLALRLQEPRDGGCPPRPIRRLVPELLLAGAGELVDFGAARVLRSTPLGIEPSTPLQPLQRGEERARINLEDSARYLLNPARDTEAVHGFQAECLEDEHVKRSLNDVGIRLLHRCSTETWLVQNNSSSS